MEVAGAIKFITCLYRIYFKTKRNCIELGDFLQDVQAKGGIIIYRGKEVEVIDFNKDTIFFLDESGYQVEATKQEIYKHKIWVVYEKGIFICDVKIP